jgi:hypothetical protein
MGQAVERRLPERILPPAPGCKSHQQRQSRQTTHEIIIVNEGGTRSAEV